MKCICGYESNRYEFMRFEELVIIEEGSQYQHKLKDKPTIFGCPKCGTIKVEMPRDYRDDA